MEQIMLSPSSPLDYANLFLQLAIASGYRGEDLEDVARDLAQALKHIISEGLNTNSHQTIIAEVTYLMNFSNDKTHRPDSILIDENIKETKEIKDTKRAYIPDGDKYP